MFILLFTLGRNEYYIVECCFINRCIILVSLHPKSRTGILLFSNINRRGRRRCYCYGSYRLLCYTKQKWVAGSNEIYYIIQVSIFSYLEEYHYQNV